MEENTPLKRPRDEQEQEVIKRQKSYKDIITLLEQDEDESNQDISSLISTLQEEISSGPDLGLGQPGPYETDPDNPQSNAGTSGEEEEVEGERLMRHLLEASDDELGIPNTTDGFDVGHVDGGDMATLLPSIGGGGGGLWEFEDYEANNYYYNNLLQSEIFL